MHQFNNYHYHPDNFNYVKCVTLKPIVKVAPVPVPPPVAKGKSRRVYLVEKESYVRSLLSQCTQDDYECLLDLSKELSKIKAELYTINMDPLTHEICLDEPWIFECKVHDL